MRDFSKMACTELSAFLNTTLTNLAVKAGILHDDIHLTEAREAVDALTRVAVNSKFATLAGLRSHVREESLVR